MSDPRYECQEVCMDSEDKQQLVIYGIVMVIGLLAFYLGVAVRY